METKKCIKIGMSLRRTLYMSRNKLARWLLPNPGTIILILVLLWVQSAGALSSERHIAPVGPSATTINYQGHLADSAGNPLTGDYDMAFSLWDDSANGSLVWGPENYTAVPVSDGLFSVGLGSQTAGGIPTSSWADDRYLEVSVEGEVLHPRELLRSVPIAGMALTVPDGAISTSKLSPGTVVNRHEIEWFGDETPFMTSSTSYVNCGNVLGYGFAASFPQPAAGTMRQYRLSFSIANNLGTTGSNYARVVKDFDGTVIWEKDLGRLWAGAGYQSQQYSEPITFSEGTHLRLQVKISAPGTMWVYRVWVIAEDIVP